MATDNFDQWDPDEIDLKLREYEEAFDLEKGDYANRADLERLFEYLRLLIYVRDRQPEAVALHKQIKPFAELALNQAPEDDELRLLMIEWHNIGMRLVMQDPDKLSEYPYYAAMQELCGDREGVYAVRKLQARLNLLAYYQNWIANNGAGARLGEAEAAAVEEIEAAFEEEAQARREQWREENYPEGFLAAQRLLARFYLMNQQPNEGISALKALRDGLPEHPEYHPADVADVNMEIGHILAGFGKYKAAANYFREARETYEAGGEAWEVHAGHAEAMLEDALDRA